MAIHFIKVHEFTEGTTKLVNLEDVSEISSLKADAKGTVLAYRDGTLLYVKESLEEIIALKPVIGGPIVETVAFDIESDPGLADDLRRYGFRHTDADVGRMR